jgi:hypothetical protein
MTEDRNGVQLRSRPWCGTCDRPGGRPAAAPATGHVGPRPSTGDERAEQQHSR